MAAKKGSGFASRTQPNAAQKQGSPRSAPLSAKERRKLENIVEKKNEKLRSRYRAVRGKVVDWVDHVIEAGSLFVSIRFKDKTDFCLLFRPKIVTDEIDLCDVRTGNFRVLRQYFRRRGE